MKGNDNPSETVVNENTEEKDERNLLPDTTKFDESKYFVKVYFLFI